MRIIISYSCKVIIVASIATDSCENNSWQVLSNYKYVFLINRGFCVHCFFYTVWFFWKTINNIKCFPSRIKQTLVSLICLYFSVTLSVHIPSFACLVEQDNAVTLLNIPHAVLLRAVHEIAAVIPETLLVLLRRRHGNSLTRQERCLTFLLLGCEAQLSTQVAAKTPNSEYVILHERPELYDLKISWRYLKYRQRGKVLVMTKSYPLVPVTPLLSLILSPAVLTARRSFY